MLNGNGITLLHDVEHDENHCFCSIILPVVNGAYHLNNGFSLAEHLDISINVTNSEVALLNIAKVYHVVMVPSKFLARRELISHSNDFRIFLWKIRNLCAIPALLGAKQFRGFYICHMILFS